MNRAKIEPGYWADRLAVNASQAVFHQWEQLEASGCIENFRIAAGESQSYRTGWFFADSDAFKWLDAASRIWRETRDKHLGLLMDDFIHLLARAQAADGYLFTYNHIHFPGVRWQNLQIEHELYCHGHLIEAGVSHFEATGRTEMLTIARKAADRIVEDFAGKGADHTPGHEEIEIALLRLHTVTPGDTAYLDMARQFIENRGKVHGFGWKLLRQQLAVNRRSKWVAQDRGKYFSCHPGLQPDSLPPENPAVKPPLVKLRWILNALNGKYFQQQTPLMKQTRAEGHAVRFTYLQTAAAMLACELNNSTLIPPLERAWDSMVLRRMYITGGVGSLPELEGFGNDFELDEEFAYNETCAALGSLFWNWEMVNLTGAARYSDLFEWQLYNAAAVGMSADGKGYFYNNPLSCREPMRRLPWYAVPCCPSNLSRTFASLGNYIYSTRENSLVVHQYISSSWSGEIPLSKGGYAHCSIQQESWLPWEGKVRLTIDPASTAPIPVELLLRQPSWAGNMSIKINGRKLTEYSSVSKPEGDDPASGYDPRRSVFRSIQRNWSAGDVVNLEFSLPIQLRYTHRRVKGHHGKVAVTRGPLVFCLESVDHSGADLFGMQLDPESLQVFSEEGSVKLRARSRTGEPMTFIPYASWGNHGPSQMTVWVNT